jgi:hypothetical protein
VALYRGRSTWTLDDMGMRRQQLGFWHFIGVASATLIIDLIATTFFALRRKVVGSPDELGAKHPTRARRVAAALLPHLILWGVLIGGFLAIVHFGPLKPVHEWTQ